MKEVIEVAVKKFGDALSRLKEGIDSTKDELDKDGVIQRFEFTFELLWKALKIYLEQEGIIVKTPKESFRESFKIGLIEDEEVFLDILEDRNRTSHTYDKNVSEEIYSRIKSTYFSAMNKVLDKLKKGIVK